MHLSFSANTPNSLIIEFVVVTFFFFFFLYIFFCCSLSNEKVRTDRSCINVNVESSVRLENTKFLEASRRSWSASACCRFDEWGNVQNFASLCGLFSRMFNELDVRHSRGHKVARLCLVHVLQQSNGACCTVQNFEYFYHRCAWISSPVCGQSSMQGQPIYCPGRGSKLLFLVSCDFGPQLLCYHSRFPISSGDIVSCILCFNFRNTRCIKTRTKVPVLGRVVSEAVALLDL